MKAPDSINTSWRKTASAIYRKPDDSKIFGSVEIDITGLKAYIEQKRRDGIKATYTHIFTLAAARAVRTDVPQFNTYIRRGNVVMRKHIDVTVSVLLPENQMGSVLIRDADKLTLEGLIDEMSLQVRRSRQGTENRAMKMKEVLAWFPWPLRNWIFRFVKTVTVKWGLPLRPLGLSADSFGSFLVSNIGSLGLEMGFPALFPTSNVSFVLILGGINEKPWVVDGRVVPRTVISIGSAIDHRVADAYHGGVLFRQIKHYVNNPQLLDEAL